MHANKPTLEGFEQVLESIATNPRLPSDFPGWVRASLRTAGLKIQILRYIFDHAPNQVSQPSLLDVGAQFGSLAIYAARLGCRVAAVDYGPFAQCYGELASDYGVEYKECDLGDERLPFPDGTFDFVTYTDVIEHHSFSSKRVLQGIHRILAPGGRLILLTPNHASIYNRIRLLLGRNVNDDFDYFFETCAKDAVYDGHHREYTRSEISAALVRTQFRVLECSVVEQDLAPLIHYLFRHTAESQGLPKFRDLMLSALGKIWTPLRLPFGRWIWAVGKKESA
jgi:SAM-dependent methyltransferase